MKFRLIFALCLFLADPLVAPCSVTVKSIPESLQRPRITVLLNGAPVPGAIIEIEKQSKYPRHNKKLRFRLVTDNKGQVVLPRLRYGLYRIDASATPNLKAGLYLNFSRHVVHTPTGGPLLPGEVGTEGLFSMDLQSFPSREQMLAADEQLPITKISAFRGVVSDQSGASIPNVPIEIVQKGTEAKTHTIRLHSNAQGKFSAKLANGDYIAFFAKAGFSTNVLHLAISKAETSRDLQVVLRLAPATE